MPYPEDFIASVQEAVGSLPSEYYEPDYLQDVKNLPPNILETLKKEEDYELAMQKQKGVMFDLTKQLCGFKHRDIVSNEVDKSTGESIVTIHSGKTYLPAPQYYHYFAYTAYALLHGDLTLLNWRTVFNKNIHGKDVSEAINKMGIYGLTENLIAGKKLTRPRFSALYARIYNADPRFQGVQCATPQTLHVETRLSPLSYCPVCKVIQKAWDPSNEKYYPVNPEYAMLLSRVNRQFNDAKTDRDSVEDQGKYISKGVLLNSIDYLDRSDILIRA